MIIFSEEVKPDWKNVKKTADRIMELCRDKNIGFADSVMMASSELLENAVKYGILKSRDNTVKIEVEKDDETLIITVANKIDATGSIQEVIEHIDKIRNSDNKMDLYVDRMNQLKGKREKGESKLGFYRIAYEGKFNLEYKYADDLLTIIAKRKIMEGENE